MIENYKSLLRAIVNQDNLPESPYGVLVVYDMWDNEKVIAIYSNSRNCAKFFHTRSRYIDCYVTKKKLRARRFMIKRVKLDR